MTRIRFTSCALALACVPCVAFAGVDAAGTTVANFLSIGSGAAVLSMGGASMAGGRDLDAAAWNPAALSWTNETRFALSHATLADATSQEWISMAGRVGRGATRYAVSALYQGESGFEGRDALNNPTGALDVASMALGVQVARPLSSRVNAGLGAKWVSEKLADASGSGLGFDAGLQARSGAFGFGIAARNLGGKLRYSGASYDLPSTFGAGLSWEDPARGVRVALDANFPKAYYNDLRAGAEWRWNDRVALRTGYRFELGADGATSRGGPTFGLGTGVGGVWMDYAFLTGGLNDGTQHRIGLSLRPAAFGASAGGAALGSRSESHDTTPTREPATEPVARSKPKPAPPAKTSVTPAREQSPNVRASETDPVPVAPRPTPRAATVKPSDAPKPAESAASVDAAKPVAPTKPLEPSAASRSARPVEAAPAPLALTMPEGALAPEASAPRPRKPAKKALAPSEPLKVPEPVRPNYAAEEPATRFQPTKVEAAIVEKPAIDATEARPAAPRPEKIVTTSTDTLEGLAKRWDVSVAALMMENNLVSTKLKPGTRLRLPPAGRR